LLGISRLEVIDLMAVYGISVFSPQSCDNYAGGKMSRWITNSGLSKNGLIWLKSNSPLAIPLAY
jgi:hypothetical protein